MNVEQLIARELSEQGEIEEIKTRAITADVVDEIATSAYISQQQRQQEAEQILNPREHLERSLALTYGEDEESEPIVQKQLAEPEKNGESERAERALQLKAKGWGKAKIILEVWGVSKGGSPKYKAAEAEYRRLTEGGWNRGPGGELRLARPPGRAPRLPEAHNRVVWYPVQNVKNIK